MDMQTTPPIKVSDTTVTTTLAAAGRYLVVILSSLPILMTLLGERDVVSIFQYFQGEDGSKLIVAAVGLGTLLYGLFRTHIYKKQLIVTAKSAPNAVATVK